MLRIGGRLMPCAVAVSLSGCILTKDLPDPALDVPGAYQAARFRRWTGGAASGRAN
jgi:multidrug efflux system outer membrane protein